jgi:hypothetical protein
MLHFFMSLSPSIPIIPRRSDFPAPAVCKLVTLGPFNGNLYPVSFQYICQPSSPSCLNGKPLILFPFIPLRTLSSPTGGIPPLVYPERSPRRAHLRYFSLAFPSSKSSRYSTPFLPIASGLFCTMGACNTSIYSGLRTLSIAMGVYPPTRNQGLFRFGRGRDELR